jgi:hypothetical protein
VDISTKLVLAVHCSDADGGRTAAVNASSFDDPASA